MAILQQNDRVNAGADGGKMAVKGQKRRVPCSKESIVRGPRLGGWSTSTRLPGGCARVVLVEDG